ncbi:MAG: DivIVA domain-containing protein [Actinomycetota bacterium]
MELEAQDIHEKQFNDAWRGYNQEEVDDFLDEVAETVDRLQRENRSLRQRVGELDESVATSRNAEAMLKKTLVSAQQAAEEAIAVAKRKAEQLIREAEERARRAAEESSRRSAETEREHATRKRTLDADIERLKAFEADLKNRLKSFLEQQQRALDDLRSEPARSVRPAPSRGAEPGASTNEEHPGRAARDRSAMGRQRERG